MFGVIRSHQGEGGISKTFFHLLKSDFWRTRSWEKLVIEHLILRCQNIHDDPIWSALPNKIWKADPPMWPPKLRFSIFGKLQFRGFSGIGK